MLGGLELSRFAPPGTSPGLRELALARVGKRLSGGSRSLSGALGERVGIDRRRGVIAFLAAVPATLLMMGFAPARTFTAWDGLLHPLAVLVEPALPPVTVEPGTTEVARGSVVEVRADAPLRDSVMLRWDVTGQVTRSRTIVLAGGSGTASLPPGRRRDALLDRGAGRGEQRGAHPHAGGPALREHLHAGGDLPAPHRLSARGVPERGPAAHHPGGDALQGARPGEPRNRHRGADRRRRTPGDALRTPGRPLRGELGPGAQRQLFLDLHRRGWRRGSGATAPAGDRSDSRPAAGDRDRLPGRGHDHAGESPPAPRHPDAGRLRGGQGGDRRPPDQRCRGCG